VWYSSSAEGRLTLTPTRPGARHCAGRWVFFYPPTIGVVLNFPIVAKRCLLLWANGEAADRMTNARLRRSPRWPGLIASNVARPYQGNQHRVPPSPTHAIGLHPTVAHRGPARPTRTHAPEPRGVSFIQATSQSPRQRRLASTHAQCVTTPHREAIVAPLATDGQRWPVAETIGRLAQLASALP
jgi:hypothetical protein